MAWGGCSSLILCAVAGFSTGAGVVLSCVLWLALAPGRV
ncbi:hypothetical protein SPLC1_S082590 [Arthrospira platensis C1]|nr:hypothetical protein SPLC1_S082590 [Arthrospira platensis C1]